MGDFESRVLPVITDYARNVFKDEQKAQDAIGYCWYRYQLNTRSPEITAKSHAWMAILAVRYGRRLPGERKPWHKDALDRAVSGAGMDEVRDRRPGPDRLAEMREEWQSLLSKLNKRQRDLLDLAEMRTSDLAERFGVSAARISQLRREIEELTKE